jgi:polar amino acid transport system substrate-binding protein
VRRRRWFWVMAGLVAVSMVAAACGNGDDDVTPDTDDDETPAFSTVSEGTLTVATSPPWEPFEFRDEDGELIGFDIDIAEEVAERIGIGRDNVEWFETDFDTIFTQLASERFDMIASGTTITEERAEIVNFSDPYFNDQQSLVVNTNETPDIQSVDDLGEGDSVAVQRGTTGEEWARQNLDPQGVEVRSFPDAPDTYISLEAGEVTGVIFDMLASFAEAANRPGLEVVEGLETGEQYGLPINPENEELLDAVNQALQDMLDDGTYQEIYDRWFPDQPFGSILYEE